MTRILVCSAVFGGYDMPPTLHPEASRAFDWVHVTDDATVHAPGWRVLHAPRIFADDKLNVQMVKTRPHLFFGEDAICIWIDSTFRNVLFNEAVLEALFLSRNAAVAAPRHAERNTGPDAVRREAQPVRRLGYDSAARIAAALRLLDVMGLPPSVPLSATLCVLRDLRDPLVRLANETWWRMILAGSRRDQLSFDAAFWAHGLAVADAGIAYRGENPYFTRAKHRNPANRTVTAHAAPGLLPHAPDGGESWTRRELALFRALRRLARRADGGLLPSLLWLEQAFEPEVFIPDLRLAPRRLALQEAARGLDRAGLTAIGDGTAAALLLTAHPALILHCAAPPRDGTEAAIAALLARHAGPRFVLGPGEGPAFTPEGAPSPPNPSR